jgi:hypothetical protein
MSLCTCTTLSVSLSPEDAEISIRIAVLTGQALIERGEFDEAMSFFRNS